jgi:hypothetical protein
MLCRVSIFPEGFVSHWSDVQSQVVSGGKMQMTPLAALDVIEVLGVTPKISRPPRIEGFLRYVFRPPPARKTTAAWRNRKDGWSIMTWETRERESEREGADYIFVTDCSLQVNRSIKSSMLIFPNPSSCPRVLPRSIGKSRELLRELLQTCASSRGRVGRGGGLELCGAISSRAR